MREQVNVASCSSIMKLNSQGYEKAVNSIKKELEALGITLVINPEFKRQGNFVLCKVMVRKTKGKKVFTGYGISKRDIHDPKNPFAGRMLALQRALFGKYYEMSIANQLGLEIGRKSLP